MAWNLTTTSLPLLGLLCAVEATAQQSDTSLHFLHHGNDDRTHEHHEKYPEHRVRDSIDHARFEEEYARYLQTYDPHARSTYVVPVVVHVLHKGGEENISDDQIFNAINLLNEDFNKANDDLANTVPPFDTIVGDAGIEFRIVQKDPDQNPHPGITRTYSSFTVIEDEEEERKAIDAIVAQHGYWPDDKYMNIIVCKDAQGFAGYTRRPSNAFSGMKAGIFMRYDRMGSTGVANAKTRHTLSHEAGHWLSLKHCWGDNNTPGQEGGCEDDDGVADTPRTIGWKSCELSSNTCSNDTVDGYWTTDVIDNVQNIMEYSYCSTMFTRGQAARMQAALNSSIAGRNNLWQADNLAATGVDGPPKLQQVAFSTDVRTICVGEQITYHDQSEYFVTSRNWTFEGGTPPVSDEKNPVITYSSPGLYPVRLEGSNSVSTLDTTATDYLVVLPDEGKILPYFEGFEAAASPSDFASWLAVGREGKENWSVVSVAGASGSERSVKLSNYGVAEGSISELVSEPIDLSGLSSSQAVVFDFSYAYRKRKPANDEELKCYMSIDCGKTWLLRKSISGDDLSTLTATEPYTPASTEEWAKGSISSIPSYYHVPNLMFKLAFKSDGGNNLYIDNIQLRTGTTSGLDEDRRESGVTVSPNPAHQSVSIQLKGKAGERVVLQLFSATGQQLAVVYEGYAQSENHTLTYPVEQLEKGVYLLRVITEDDVQTVRWVKA